MPTLGIAANTPASAKGVPRRMCNAGIKKATELTKQNALAVTTSAITTIDHRAAVLRGSIRIHHACTPGTADVVWRLLDLHRHAPSN
ncbi:MAG: hypothetical protein PHQ28_16880 [Mycobacterium sp.]|nr:hypothetical protein [Mycobacterium sp.]